MKIAVIGAGAMGCLYGAYLSQSHDVYMIDALPEQVNAINNHGITVSEEDGRQQNYPNVVAYLSGQCPQVVDLIIIFVKSTYTEHALAQNHHLFKPSTIVMTLQNGAGNDRKISQYIAPENIIIGTSKHNVVNLGNGCINHSGSGVTNIGSNYEATPLMTKVSDLLTQAGFEINVANDIQRIIWSKLLVNLSVNTFTAITMTPIGYMIKNDSAWDFAKRLIYEAIEVAEADGTYFDRREALEMVKDVCIKAEDGYSSMYQDRKRRVKMEIDAINGAIVEQAKQYGVPTPYNTLIVALIHAIEGAYDLYD
ncbi:ketopantoate reductase family protein [Celerinatantimonas diazotrophica]|uniref:2-dehydropantoate 2-reductase n=1 Tax=Celerinatantimonas diazotrophica TaxID=412034 RepID=A0A4R1K1S8_9GAMM|nr:2-dehydropantoate 2-reductase [Celerinatantimonas diazotrophica]TCK57860.1 ketopantoate reductase [Celerinatantimonas diazotrophica]CAG9298074.1 2-dehydropantoate 2-reductase [Celerinatantimonas diazotrophica]